MHAILLIVVGCSTTARTLDPGTLPSAEAGCLDLCDAIALACAEDGGDACLAACDDGALDCRTAWVEVAQTAQSDADLAEACDAAMGEVACVYP